MIAAIAANVRLSEWEKVHLPGVRLTPSDRILAEQLSESRLEIAELLDGLSVESRGWIGVVQLESCTIRVEPSLIDGHRNLVRLIDYVRRLNLFQRLPTDVWFEAEGLDLFDLLAGLLADACDAVLRMGVQADYRPQRDDLTVVRGRLDVRAQILQRFARLDRLVCDFEDRVRDIPENQWLLRALRVARRGVRDPERAVVVRRLASTWEELCDDDPSEELPRPVITRVNDHYRHALGLAYLVVEGAALSDVLLSGRMAGFSFMLNMPQLFEEFASCVLEQVLAGSGVRVMRQASDSSVLWDAEAYRPFGNVRPDLLLAGNEGRVRLPVDAKYKNYDIQRLQPSDVYQAAIYALALARTSSSSDLRSCVLLYPSSRRGVSRLVQRVQVRAGDAGPAEVIVVGLPVSSLLDDVRAAGTDYRRSDWYIEIVSRCVAS